MDLKPSFEHAYPEGSVGPGTGDLRGQCAVFAEHVVKIPTGDGVLGEHLAQKRQHLAQWGRPASFRAFEPGDVLIWDYQPDGHVAVVNCIINGKLRVSE